jgi:hypothetical protein
VFVRKIPDDVIEFVEKKDEKDKKEQKESLSVEMKTPNKLARIVIRAVPLPASVVKIIENSEAVLKVRVDGSKWICFC